MSYPVAREPYVCFTTTTQARFRWNTYRNVETTLTVAGQEAPSYGMIHRADFGGLQAATVYPYTLKILGKTVLTSAFRTPPASGLLKFIVMGNSSLGSQVQQRMARALDRHDPDLVLHAGTVLYHATIGIDRDKYDKWYFNQYGPLTARCPIYSVLGAHDYLAESGIDHWVYFDKPGKTPGLTPYGADKNFTVRASNVEFFCADGWDPVPTDHIHTDLGGGQVGPSTFGGTISTSWLTAALAASTATWKILIHNQTPYTVESTHGNETVLRGLLDPIIPGQMQIVFGALSSLYHRSDYVANGAVQAAGAAPVYVQVGTAGQATNPTGPAQVWTVYQEAIASYTYCEINGTDFTGTTYGLPGYFTVDAATDTITSANTAVHGLSNNQRVLFFTTGTLPAGLDPATLYYVVGATGTTFQVSLTQGGAAVDLSAAAGSGRHMFQRRIDTWTQTA